MPFTYHMKNIKSTTLKTKHKEIITQSENVIILTNFTLLIFVLTHINTYIIINKMSKVCLFTINLLFYTLLRKTKIKQSYFIKVD